MVGTLWLVLTLLMDFLLFQTKKIQLFHYLLIFINSFVFVFVSRQSPGVHIITVYDIQNKLIAYSGPLSEVTDVLCDWGALYVLTGDNRLHLLQEKDTQTKLEILFKKNLYHLAIR